jgi:deoxyribodipyrimidine photo-lyase
MKTVILWYRNDLRVHDLPALAAAAQADFVVPVFVFNQTLLGGKHSSSNRNRFLLESLEDLKRSLQDLGADLVVRQGKPEAALLKLMQETGATEVICTEDFSPFAVARDIRVAKAIEDNGYTFTQMPGRLAIDSFDDLVTGTGGPYKVFTPFWRKWGGSMRRDILQIPTILQLPSGIEIGKLPTIEDISDREHLAPNPLKGGESAARARMSEWLQTGIHDYDTTHDLVGRDATSRLSSYLHFGCISVRELETLIPYGEGPAAWHRQLCWRDFYHYIMKAFPNNAQLEYQERYRDMDWSYDESLLQAWKEGKTGYPIVDAAMRQLLSEGWMHNRARLIVGSFLTKDLALDWRLGEQHFMKHLIDGDQANNNGNWQWIASVGVDPAPVFRRLYNPTRQQERYDEEGTYVRKYVPELRDVPLSYVSEPSKMSKDEQMAAGSIIGEDYPMPIVDHAKARDEALVRYRR